ncbi:MAG: hypothetical protein ACOY7U_09530 [Acidobacteriota bacterium]|nr:hypothetical protein [Thermoanaerobaculum aquaticum]KDA53334.1 hypothetical protein EG19_06175 [Thermoanaerobaculum aquaticum]BCW92650.1 MAG: hypothetical protein KatS3mg007_0544 [Thermoanaerobaculum sp.]
MKSEASPRDLEGVLGALAEALGRAASRDPRLRPLFLELKRLGLEARLVLRVRIARPGSAGFAIEIQPPWSQGWNRDDVEALHALGIALESDDQQVFPPEPDGRSHR